VGKALDKFVLKSEQHAFGMKSAFFFNNYQPIPAKRYTLYPALKPLKRKLKLLISTEIAVPY
jgi:hypothetical protein